MVLDRGCGTALGGSPPGTTGVVGGEPDGGSPGACFTSGAFGGAAGFAGAATTGAATTGAGFAGGTAAAGAAAFSVVSAPEPGTGPAGPVFSSAIKTSPVAE
jgi:hypothetical protein